jgi:hypothetical protein
VLGLDRHIPKVGIQYPTMKIPREWEAHGETIIQATSEPSTGGVILKKDQPGWTSDGRLSGQRFVLNRICHGGQ